MDGPKTSRNMELVSSQPLPVPSGTSGTGPCCQRGRWGSSDWRPQKQTKNWWIMQEKPGGKGLFQVRICATGSFIQKRGPRASEPNSSSWKSCRWGVPLSPLPQTVPLKGTRSSPKFSLEISAASGCPGSLAVGSVLPPALLLFPPSLGRCPLVWSLLPFPSSSVADG